MVEEKQEALNVVISGAAGQIGYSLIPLVLGGTTFGTKQLINLKLLDIEFCKDKLEGVCMEIDDCSYELLNSLEAGYDAEVAFKDADYVFLVGGFPRRQGMIRKDLLAKNNPIFVGQGKALDKVAKKSVKVVVVANPANTNCLVLANYAPSIPKENFSALTRLDLNRAKSQIATKLKTNPSNITGITIWGNHSKTQVPDATKVQCCGKPIKEGAIDQKWLDEEFVSIVQQRGKAIIDKRGLSSASSAANAAANHMHDWHFGTDTYVSMAVWSTGNPYGVPEGLIYSFPVVIKDGKWEIVKDLKLTKEVEAAMKVTSQELQEEKAEALPQKA